MAGSARQALDTYYEKIESSLKVLFTLEDESGDIIHEGIQLATLIMEPATDEVVASIGDISKDAWPAFNSDFVAATCKFWQDLCDAEPPDSDDEGERGKNPDVMEMLDHYKNNKEKFDEESFKAVASGPEVTKDDLKKALMISKIPAGPGSAMREIGCAFQPLVALNQLELY
mmetsp:Transcript_75221/g.135492  ORF Transcript_75221/g.135492 Transcript_75221/m.135492 type:complete len:172 (+) Transcript_75221:102-617(+)